MPSARTKAAGTRGNLQVWDPVDWTLESESRPLKAPYEIYFQTVAGGKEGSIYALVVQAQP